MIYELFPEEYIMLQKEIATGFHPPLETILAGIPVEDLDLKLAQCAAYVEVMLDGEYNLTERRKLCSIITKKLEAKRILPKSIIIH